MASTLTYLTYVHASLVITMHAYTPEQVPVIMLYVLSRLNRIWLAECFSVLLLTCMMRHPSAVSSAFILPRMPARLLHADMIPVYLHAYVHES